MYVREIYLKRSHKERKDSLETRAVLLIFSLEHEISGVAVQSIHQTAKNSDFEAVLATFAVMTMMLTLLRQFTTSLQIKKNITNAPCVL